MSKKNTKSVLLLLTLIITGCATSYKPAGFFNDGYKDMALSNDIYKVSFKGNSDTSKSTVQDYLLRRCAEITMQKGYKYFIIMDGNTEAAHKTSTIPLVHTYSDHSLITYHQSSSEEYEDSFIIKLLKNNKVYKTAFSANVILNNFKN